MAEAKDQSSDDEQAVASYDVYYFVCCGAREIKTPSKNKKGFCHKFYTNSVLLPYLQGTRDSTTKSSFSVDYAINKIILTNRILTEIEVGLLENIANNKDLALERSISAVDIAIGAMGNWPDEQAVSSMVTSRQLLSEDLFMLLQLKTKLSSEEFAERLHRCVAAKSIWIHQGQLKDGVCVDGNGKKLRNILKSFTDAQILKLSASSKKSGASKSARLLHNRNIAASSNEEVEKSDDKAGALVPADVGAESGATFDAHESAQQSDTNRVTQATLATQNKIIHYLDSADLFKYDGTVAKVVDHLIRETAKQSQEKEGPKNALIIKLGVIMRDEISAFIRGEIKYIGNTKKEDPVFNQFMSQSRPDADVNVDDNSMIGFLKNYLAHDERLIRSSCPILFGMLSVAMLSKSSMEFLKGFESKKGLQLYISGNAEKINVDDRRYRGSETAVERDAYRKLGHLTLANRRTFSLIDELTNGRTKGYAQTFTNRFLGMLTAMSGMPRSVKGLLTKYGKIPSRFTSQGFLLSMGDKMVLDAKQAIAEHNADPNSIALLHGDNMNKIYFNAALKMMKEKSYTLIAVSFTLLFKALKAAADSLMHIYHADKPETTPDNLEKVETLEPMMETLRQGFISGVDRVIGSIRDTSSPKLDGFKTLPSGDWQSSSTKTLLQQLFFFLCRFSLKCDKKDVVLGLDTEPGLMAAKFAICFREAVKGIVLPIPPLHTLMGLEKMQYGDNQLFFGHIGIPFLKAMGWRPNVFNSLQQRMMANLERLTPRLGNSWRDEIVALVTDAPTADDGSTALVNAQSSSSSSSSSRRGQTPNRTVQMPARVDSDQQTELAADSASSSKQPKTRKRANSMAGSSMTYSVGDTASILLPASSALAPTSVSNKGGSKKRAPGEASTPVSTSNQGGPKKRSKSVSSLGAASVPALTQQQAPAPAPAPAPQPPLDKDQLHLDKLFRVFGNFIAVDLAEKEDRLKKGHDEFIAKLEAAKRKTALAVAAALSSTNDGDGVDIDYDVLDSADDSFPLEDSNEEENEHNMSGLGNADDDDDDDDDDGDGGGPSTGSSSRSSSSKPAAIKKEKQYMKFKQLKRFFEGLYAAAMAVKAELHQNFGENANAMLKYEFYALYEELPFMVASFTDAVGEGDATDLYQTYPKFTLLASWYDHPNLIKYSVFQCTSIVHWVAKRPDILKFIATYTKSIYDGFIEGRNSVIAGYMECNGAQNFDSDTLRRASILSQAYTKLSSWGQKLLYSAPILQGDLPGALKSLLWKSSPLGREPKRPDGCEAKKLVDYWYTDANKVDLEKMKQYLRNRFAMLSKFKINTSDSVHEELAREWSRCKPLKLAKEYPGYPLNVFHNFAENTHRRELLLRRIEAMPKSSRWIYKENQTVRNGILRRFKYILTRRGQQLTQFLTTYGFPPNFIQENDALHRRITGNISSLNRRDSAELILLILTHIVRLRGQNGSDENAKIVYLTDEIGMMNNDVMEPMKFKFTLNSMNEVEYSYETLWKQAVENVQTIANKFWRSLKESGGSTPSTKA